MELEEHQRDSEAIHSKCEYTSELPVDVVTEVEKRTAAGEVARALAGYLVASEVHTYDVRERVCVCGNVCSSDIPVWAKSTSLSACNSEGTSSDALYK